MTLRKFLTVLRRRIRLVLLLLVVAVAGAGAFNLLATPTYKATAGLFFSVRTAQGVDDLNNGANYTHDQMASYASLVDTPTVLEPVATRLDYPGGATALAQAVSATASTSTVVLTVTATDTDPRRAAEIANAVAERTITVVEDLSPEDPQGGGAAMKVSIVTPAAVPPTAASPKTGLNLAAGVVLGLALGVLVALAREALDTRVRSAEDVAQLLAQPVIGSLGSVASRRGRVTMETAPHSPQAEAYRQLRTNLQFLDVGRRLDVAGGAARVLTVTSTLAGEGKSTVALNLALSLAETSARVLLVDADLRRPSIASVLGVEAAAGLTTVLLGEADAADVVQEWGRSGLQVLTSGPLPPNPSELLASPAMRRLLDGLRQDYDYVILDSAPLLPVADGAILSRLMDGTIMVLNVTKVRRHQLAESLRTLTQVEARVLGVVLNQVARDERTYGYYRADGGPATSGAGNSSRQDAGSPAPVAR